MIVFVYGTLKRGGCRHHHLGEAEFLGTASTMPDFRLFDCGEYPGMVRSESGLSIEGELWRIDRKQISELDDVEGVDLGLYERVEIKVQDESLQVIFAWTYLYLRSTHGMPDLGTRWLEDT